MRTREQAKPPSGQAPAILHRVIGSPGRPLAPPARRMAAQRLGHDFGDVRVHADADAAASARAVGAHAYAVGRHVVFGAGRFDPGSERGAGLLVHELAHVVQQRGRDRRAGAPLALRPAGDAHERVATAIGQGRSGAKPAAGSAPVSVQRQDPAAATASTGCRICARPLLGAPQYGPDHAYVEAPGKRYGIIHPFCPQSEEDGVWGETTARKWDNSPDPCGQTPTCVECRPREGVPDVAACLQQQFDAYNSPNLYSALGPNSNTFAGTLARACCAGMERKPAIGTVPGWYDAPAPARAAGADCPPGPTCQ